MPAVAEYKTLGACKLSVIRLPLMVTSWANSAGMLTLKSKSSRLVWLAKTWLVSWLVGSWFMVEADEGLESREWRVENRGAGEGMRPDLAAAKPTAEIMRTASVPNKTRFWGKDKRGTRRRGVADRREGDLWAENWPIFSRSEGEYLL